MVTVITIAIALYVLFYVALMAWFFKDPLPLRKYLQYSTIILLIMIAVLVIALAVAGKLFSGLIERPYF